jgi:hypothetical protein
MCHRESRENDYILMVMIDDSSISPGMSAYTRFFAPLALHAASQGLTYPLV